MERLTVILIVITIFLIGCAGENSSKNEISSSTKTNPTEQTMPDDMPSNFGFSVSFGYGMKGNINTYDGTVTKDLIEDGTVTADIALTDEEMVEIYEKMKEINITNPKQFVPEPKDGQMCEQIPYEEDKWEITFDNKTVSHIISGKHCEPTEDAKQFFKLRNFAFSKIKNKDEYHELPKAKGGYE